MTYFPCFKVKNDRFSGQTVSAHAVTLAASIDFEWSSQAYLFKASMYNQEDNFARMQFSFSIMILQRLQCQSIHQLPKKTIEKKKLSNKASSIEIDPNKEDNFPTPDKVGNDFLTI